MSYLADLRTRLGAAGLNAAVLAGADEPEKATAAKARRRIDLDPTTVRRAGVEIAFDLARSIADSGASKPSA